MCRVQLMRPQPMVSEQECTRCHLTKPAADFYYVPTAAKGLKKQCKACMLVRRRDAPWIAANMATLFVRGLLQLNSWDMPVHVQDSLNASVLLPALLQASGRRCPAQTLVQNH